MLLGDSILRTSLLRQDSPGGSWCGFCVEEVLAVGLQEEPLVFVSSVVTAMDTDGDLPPAVLYLR